MLNQKTLQLDHILLIISLIFELFIIIFIISFLAILPAFSNAFAAYSKVMYSKSITCNQTDIIDAYKQLDALKNYFLFGNAVDQIVKTAQLNLNSKCTPSTLSA